jgi:hypothetical protein
MHISLARHRGILLHLVLLVVTLFLINVVDGTCRSREYGSHAWDNTKRVKGPSKQATQVLQEKVHQVPLALANLLYQLPVPLLSSMLSSSSSARGSVGAQETIQRLAMTPRCRTLSRHQHVQVWGD